MEMRHISPQVRTNGIIWSGPSYQMRCMQCTPWSELRAESRPLSWLGTCSWSENRVLHGWPPLYQAFLRWFLNYKKLLPRQPPSHASPCRGDWSTGKRYQYDSESVFDLPIVFTPRKEIRLKRNKGLRGLKKILTFKLSKSILALCGDQPVGPKNSAQNFLWKIQYFWKKRSSMKP